MSLTVYRSTLEKLRNRAASAAQLVGHLDDKAQPELIRQLGEHVDTIAHELTELLGRPEPSSPSLMLPSPDDRKVGDDVPMLTSIAGGAP